MAFLTTKIQLTEKEQKVINCFMDSMICIGQLDYITERQQDCCNACLTAVEDFLSTVEVTLPI